MSDQDWELEFEDFDWGEQDSSAEVEDDSAIDDDEFAELFQSFDNVHASDELRTSALDAILSSEKEGDKLSGAKAAEKGRRSRIRRPRRARVMILAACLALVIAGAVSWFLPVTSVAVTQDNLSVVLGVNIYGITVSTSGSGELNERVVADAKATNQPLGDSLRNILDAYDALRGETEQSEAHTATINVTGPFGLGAEGVRQEAERVLENHFSMSTEANPPASQTGGNGQMNGGAQTGEPGGSKQDPGQQPTDAGAQDRSVGDPQRQEGTGMGQQQNTQQPMQEQSQPPTETGQEPSAPEQPAQDQPMDQGYSQDMGIHEMGADDGAHGGAYEDHYEGGSPDGGYDDSFGGGAAGDGGAGMAPESHDGGMGQGPGAR